MNLSELKKCQVAEARSSSLPIEHSGTSIGQLVPVGPWILHDRQLIHQMSQWRERAMKMFLTQYGLNPDRMERYLKDFSLGQDNRILFMIETEGSFVGHIGLSDVTDETAEVDQLMRGLAGGSPHLMVASERAITSWAFSELNLTRLSLTILSFNMMAKAIHEQLGFAKTASQPLRREARGDGTALVVCPAEEANVRFTADIMTLERETFLALMTSPT